MYIIHCQALILCYTSQETYDFSSMQCIMMIRMFITSHNDICNGLQLLINIFYT